jgi:hypothetical protein
MSDLSTSAALLAEIESAVDRSYQQVPLPHSNRTLATWYFLTVLEDAQRWALALTHESQGALIDLQIDRFKYSAKFALARVRAECKDVSQVTLPVKVPRNRYIAAAELLHAGVQFMSSTQLCSAAHAGTVHFREAGPDIELVVDWKHHDPRYTVLEMIGHNNTDGIDHAALMYRWFHREETLPPVVSMIASRTRLVGVQIQYVYEGGLAYGLSLEMTQPPVHVPSDWKFPWGGQHLTTVLINALCIRCMYHWVAVHFGAESHRLEGGGDASMLLVLSKRQLVDDLTQMSSQPETVIRSFIQYLTYGYEMKTPDVALQPLVPLSNGNIAIPCMLILSSNQSRNVLSLQARIEEKAFNSMSKLFECEMVQSILGQVRQLWPHARANVEFELRGKTEEIDLLVADIEHRVLLVCELRWMLQPGDPREVQNRKKVCHEKVEQLYKKVSWLKQDLGVALRKVYNLEITAADSWQVQGVVVIQTFVLTTEVFLRGMTSLKSLGQFASWSQSLAWLPREGVHFQIRANSVELESVGKRILSQGPERISGPHQYIEHLQQTLGRL